MRKLLVLAFIIGFCWMGQWVLAYDDAVIEVDNHDATFFPSPDAWKTSTARILYYGDDYKVIQCSGSTGSMTAYASYVSPRNLDVTGYYSVFARWTVDPNRSKSVRYYIYKNSTDTSHHAMVTRNQEVNGGEWRYLGTWEFEAGSTPKVVIGNDCVHESPEGTSWVVADAVRWVKQQWGRADIVDEPGIEWSKTTGSVTIASTSESSPTQLRSATLTCPREGWVVATFTSELSYNGVANNVYANVLYSISTGSGWDSNYVHQIADWVANNGVWKRAAMAMQRVDACGAGDSKTYRVFAVRGSNTVSSTYVYQPTLVLKYFPTAY